jgi:superfamily II DNA or RNA helicase
MPDLRPYQAELLDRTRAAFADGYQSPCIVLPCGGGKSCIVAEMARGAAGKGGNTLFLVHRQELVQQLSQTLRTWQVPEDSTSVMMVQTVSKHIDRLPRQPTLIVTDENHHCLAASYRSIYNALPGTPLVGITATPQRLNGGGLGDVNDVLVIGPSATWLIDNCYLSPYDYYAPTVTDLTGLRSSHGEYVRSEIEARMNRAAIHGDVIAHYRNFAFGLQTVVYCASIAHSKAVAEAFDRAGISAAHIDGDTPEADRAQIVQAFRRGELQILCNVDLISEGFDVPDCSCAILLRPTKSLTLFIQQAMRCMRYRDGKRAIIIDAVGNYARFGLPDAERAWSLDPRPAQKRDAAAGVHVCPQCLGVFPQARIAAAAQRCPYCGHLIPPKARDVEEIKAAQLQRVERFVLKYDSPDRCQTYSELLAYARLHKYKSGWAFYQAKRKGWIK